MDREKVIKTIQNRINEARNKQLKVATIFVSTLSDILAILKEQQHKIRELNEINEYLDDIKKDQEHQIDMLKEQPQIVRCKDCKHFTKPDEDGFGVCKKIMHGCQYWGFCADGERDDADA